MNHIRRIMNGDYWTLRRVGRLNQLFLSIIRGFRGFDLLRAALGVVAANGASFHAHDGATLPHASAHGALSHLRHNDRWSHHRAPDP
jgi:hypothetical protein